MNDSIIDNLYEYNKGEYAKRSFRNFFLGFSLYALLVFINIRVQELNDYHSIITLLLMLIALVLNVLGLIYGIKSIKRKEKAAFKKWFGVISNFVFILAICLILFATVVDVYVALTR